MKKLTLLVMMALFMGLNSLVLADPPPAPMNPHHPRIREVHFRMHDQLLRIREGVKAGTMTKEQAQTLKATLKAVREQMQADYTTNGKKELTDAQVAQLNQMLDQNSKAIYGDKHEPSFPDPANRPAPPPQN